MLTCSIRSVSKPLDQHSSRPRAAVARVGALIAALALPFALTFSGAALASKLTIDDGVVVKFDQDSGLTVRERLQTGRKATLTSVHDDSAAGQTLPSPGIPARGDWIGLKIEDAVAAENLQINGLILRYAGADGAAALQVAQNYAIQFLQIGNSLLGIRSTGAARPSFSGLSLIGNAVGLEAREDALPSLVDSEVVGNTDFGILNLSPQTVTQAGGTWWGTATGPTAADNAGGTGDKVGPGVAYQPFATTVPLIDCSLAVVGGAAVVSQPSVTLALDCRNAVKYRLALDGNFGSAAYQPIAATATFALSGSAGERNIAVEYRASTQNLKTAQTLLRYEPGIPVVTIDAPAGAEPVTISTDTTIAATVSDAAGIDRVEFYVDATRIGVDTAAPYDLLWPIAGFAAGPHTIKVVAVSVSGQSGSATRAIDLQPLGGGDTTGPAISAVTYAGEPLLEDATTTLTASGTLRFDVADPSGVGAVSVLLDGSALSGGSLSGSEYAIDVDLDGVADGPHTLTLEASDSLGNASERSFAIEVDTTTAPGAPVVTITAPANGAQVGGDTTVVARVTGAAITQVDFYVDATKIGTATVPPYQMVWSVAGYADGDHTLQAVATNAGGQTGQASIHVDLRRGAGDTTGPDISDVRFTGQALADGATLTTPGLLTFQLADPSGVASAAVRVGATAVSGGGLSQGQYSVLLDFEDIANGSYAFTLAAVDTLGNASERVLQNVTVTIAPPPPPILLAPVDATVTPQPNVAVAGTAQVGSRVQLFLDGDAIGEAIATSFSGTFHRTIALREEGTHTLSATASNSRGSSAASAPVSITYSAPAPNVVITSPPAGATIETNAAVAIEASVVDAIGLRAVSVKIDGAPLGAELSQPPYAWTWNVDDRVADGEHAIEVTAVNAVGKSATATSAVTVARAPTIPPVRTAYTGEVQSIAPDHSYGDEPITITGRAVDTTTGAAVPDALLKVVLRVNGFQRRIGVSTDRSGAFRFRFVPQNSDAGVHRVSVIHPEQTDLPEQGQFTINRLDLTPSQYTLHAARTIPATIRYTATASAGSGASGLVFEADPADQPSGSLPAGITIGTPAPVDVPAGGSAAIEVVFTADAQALERTGTVVLKAKESSGRARGTVAVLYDVSEPQPSLFPQPVAIQSGVKREQQISESVQLSNRGLVPARNVSVGLSEAAGPVPAWIQLVSPAELGELAVGESRSIQIVAVPGADVGDGIYRLNIHVQGDGIAGDIPVAIAVTSADIGGVLFHAKDIYTCLPDCTATPGLANATIRVQNEQVFSETRSGTTDAQGLLEITDLPTGHYRYAANAPGHTAATGRFSVRPGVSSAQIVFLDYELVSFEWSVTETTIQDQYDVNLTATYQTQVPAPVVLIEPASINLPDLQEGEELSGEITITNYGLIRADNVGWNPAQSDEYFQIEYLGTPPDALDPQQSYRLPYRVTKKCKPLPGMEGGESCTGLAQAGPLFRSVKSAASTAAAGTCRTYQNWMRIDYGYQCAAGDLRNGATGSGFTKAYGQNCSTQGGGAGGGGGGIAWPIGIGGGSSGGPIGTPMSSGPGCVPKCPDCDASAPGGR